MLTTFYKYFFKNIITNIPNNQNSIFLTFDDGPSRQTDLILEILHKKSVKATFFVICNKLEKNKTTLNRILDLGCNIGNHSLDHNPFIYFQGYKKVKQWVQDADNKLNDFLGKKNVGMRSPVGIVTPELQKALKMLNIKHYLWNVRFYDSLFPLNIRKIRQKGESFSSGDIILLHDSSFRGTEENFLKSLEELIRVTQAKGFNFETINNL